MKPNPNTKVQTRTQKNQTGPITSMTHNHCHQSESCKGESRNQRHSHTKLGTFRSTTMALLLTRQSLAFYSNRVMAADLGWSHCFWAGALIIIFQMKFKVDVHHTKKKRFTWMLIYLPDISCFKIFTFQCSKSVTSFVVQEWYRPTTVVHLQMPTPDQLSLALLLQVALVQINEGCISAAHDWRPDLNPMPPISPKY